MGLLSKLKSLLGGGEESPPRRGDVDVTVEREPSAVAESERAVKGPGAAVSGEDGDEAAAEEAAGTDETAGGEGAAGADDAAGADGTAAAEEADGPGAEPVERIKGIGPSYAGRLDQVGVGTVGELADREPAALAVETDISEKRLERWIERARARIR